MSSTLLWVALPVLAVLIESVARLAPGKVATLSQALNAVAARASGRVLLILVWIFIGVHLFARYSVAR